MPSFIRYNDYYSTKLVGFCTEDPQKVLKKVIKTHDLLRYNYFDIRHTLKKPQTTGDRDFAKRALEIYQTPFKYTSKLLCTVPFPGTTITDSIDDLDLSDAERKSELDDKDIITGLFRILRDSEDGRHILTTKYLKDVIEARHPIKEGFIEFAEVAFNCVGYRDRLYVHIRNLQKKYRKILEGMSENTLIGELGEDLKKELFPYLLHMLNSFIQ